MEITIGKIFNCSDCNKAIIRDTPNKQRCEECAHKRSLKIKRELSRRKAERTRNGDNRNYSIIEVVCGTCSNPFIRTNPMQKHCQKCKEYKLIVLSRSREARRNNKDRKKTRLKWDGMTRQCKCGTHFQVNEYQGSRYNCKLCSNIRKALNNICHKAKSIESILLKTDDLYELYLRQNKKCNLTGMILSDNGLTKISADRINNNRGHHLDNIHLVCMWANHARGKYSIDEFKAVLLEYKSLPNTVIENIIL